MNRIYKVNDDYFSIPNLENCYWAGYIAADGSITKNAIRFNLKATDKILLENLYLSCNYNGKIGQRITHTNALGYQYDIEVVYGQITSYRMCADLKNIFNITSKKSLTLQPPNLTDEELIKAFIVGYIDGDGHISISKTEKPYYEERLRVEITGTESLLLWIKGYFDKWVLKTKIKDIREMKGCFRYSIYNARAYKIGKILNDLPIWKLGRKWSVLDKYYKNHANYIETGKHGAFSVKRNNPEYGLNS